MRSTQRGFNLLEVVVGAFIFAITSVALLGVWGTHYRSLAKSRNKIVANFLAEAVIERAISDGYDGIADNSSTTTTQTVTTGLNGQMIDVVYTVQTDTLRFGNVNVVAPAREDKLKKVSVLVTWDEPGGTNKVHIETVVGSAD